MANERDGRVGQRLRNAINVRLSDTQHAYLSELAEDNQSSVSDEIRNAIDEAMVASIEARKRRQREVRAALAAIAEGTAHPEDFPGFFSRAPHS